MNWSVCAAVGATACFAATATAGEVSDVSLAQEDRIAELERTVGVLAGEIERTRLAMAVPEDRELASVFGFGPGASKVYGIEKGLSIGGYAEGFYRKNVANDGSGTGKTLDTADMLRAVLYFGYKFTDNIIWNSEIEFEHATTGSTESSGGGSASVEFAALDFLWKDWMNFRTGLLLAPVGFINEIHEPPFFFGVRRPETEQRIIPTTWRENGAGIFGNLGESISYTAYIMNGFNAEGFDSTGLRGGRQKGNRALAEDLAFVGRVDWFPAPEWWFGASVFHGASGQNQDISVKVTDEFTNVVDIPDADTTIFEGHAQYEGNWLHLRGLVAASHVNDAGSLSRALGPIGTDPLSPGGTGELSKDEAVSEWMIGGYAEIAYEVLHCLFPDTDKTLHPFFRYEYVDTQLDVPSGFSKDERRRNQYFTTGLQYKPIPNVVLKADYRNAIAGSGKSPDEVNFGFGLVF